MTEERRYTPAEVAALLDGTSAGSAEREALDRLYPMEVAAAQWEQLRQKAAALKANQEADDEHAELCENCTAELNSAAECIDGSWLCAGCWPEAAKEAADVVAIDAYEESVTLRLSDLRYEGTWWTYGHVVPLHANDEARGWGCWLECTVGRESDTGVWLSEPEWSSFEGAADEAAARAEATRRNRGEG